MSKSVLTSHQPSITEWFAELGSAEANKLRAEDNTKAERLETLFQEIGLPYERPEPFEARDLTTPSPQFQKVLSERGNELCAIRLVPKKDNLPKLRNRGLTIKECYETWYKKQDINPKDYIAFVCPHSDSLLWSTIFVVNEQGIFGEIVEGLHSQLTHGDTNATPYQFFFNFNTWIRSAHSAEAQRYIEQMAQLLRVSKNKQFALVKKLQATFAHNYLQGYFEATVWPDHKPYFIDYSRTLGARIGAPLAPFSDQSNGSTLYGLPVYPGQVKGRAVIIDDTSITKALVGPTDILVCRNTDVRFLPLMQQAAAIVTEQGGMLSHASIVARELKKPCIVGIKNLTKTIKSGDTINVDCTKGVVSVS